MMELWKQFEGLAAVLRPKGVHLSKFWMLSLPAKADLGMGAEFEGCCLNPKRSSQGKSELSGSVTAPLWLGL